MKDNDVNANALVTKFVLLTVFRLLAIGLAWWLVDWKTALVVLLVFATISVYNFNK